MSLVRFLASGGFPPPRAGTLLILCARSIGHSSRAASPPREIATYLGEGLSAGGGPSSCVVGSHDSLRRLPAVAELASRRMSLPNVRQPPVQSTHEAVSMRGRGHPGTGAGCRKLQLPFVCESCCRYSEDNHFERERKHCQRAAPNTPTVEGCSYKSRPANGTARKARSRANAFPS